MSRLSQPPHPSLMPTSIGTRRSPRFIENLCDGLLIPYLSYEPTATVLALAHCTGWSADAISNKLVEAAGIRLSPEFIWDFHWSWVWGGKFYVRRHLSSTDWYIMQVLMRNIGVELAKPNRPLSETTRPTTVKFAEQWTAKKDDTNQPLFAGWTTFLRDAVKGYLLMHGPDTYGKLSPHEEEVMAKLGEAMLSIMRDILQKWALEMEKLVNAEPGLRPIQGHAHAGLIMVYLRMFKKSYEELFGKMESGKHTSELGELKENTVFIKSTGYGVKVLLGLIMADRMHVVERRRTIERERLGFMPVEAEDLDHDSKDCPICQDPMGVKSSDGAEEMPLRLVICCGQIIGSECLKTWLSEFVFDDHRDTCPVCRFKFSTSFMERLFTEEELAERNASKGLDLQSPAHSPAGPMRSQQEQDAFMQQQFGGGDELHDDSELMDIETMMDEAFSAGMRAAMRRPSRPAIVDRSVLLRQVELGEVMEDELMGDDFLMEG